MVLEHHGVKGMHWGVRKDRESSGVHPHESHTTEVESGINKKTADAAREVSSLMRDRYGLNIKHVRVLDEKNEHYDPNMLAYVQNNKLAAGKHEGTIFVIPKDITQHLKDAEADGWNARGTGNAKGLLTHEAAHTLFHSDQNVKIGALGGYKITGGEIKARDKALKVALKTARQDHQNIWHISGYANYAQVREELEAEMLSQYHWADHPARFVQEWGKTLHKELGVDATPFKEVKKHVPVARVHHPSGIPK